MERDETWDGISQQRCDRARRKTRKLHNNSKRVCNHFGEVGRFKEMLFAAAVKAGYGSVKNTVVIGDGAHWIWNMCDECFPDGIRILDYYHMAENVYEYANELFSGDEKKKVGWAKEIIRHIKTAQYDKAIKAIKKDELKSESAKITVNLQVCFNKVVIQKRMKLCGMRWSVYGGQCAAALRAKSQSKQWDSVKLQIFSGNTGNIRKVA